MSARRAAFVFALLALMAAHGAAANASTSTLAPQAFAHAVNLSAASIPGFDPVLEDGEQEAHTGPLSREVEQCDGGPLIDEASHGIASPLLQKRSVPIETIVSAVYPTAGASTASRYLSAADSKRGVKCIQRAEAQKDAGLSEPPRVEAVSLRDLGPGKAVSGVRVWKCLAGSEPCASRDARSFEDRLSFARGPYVVALFFIAGARNAAKSAAPLALPIERRLIVLLQRRALEAPVGDL